MIKPERNNFMSETAYNLAVEKYENYLNYILQERNIVKTISGSSHIWDAMVEFCEETEQKKSHFIFQAIKEKLERER